MASPWAVYDRQLGLPGLGPAEQERLGAATVLVAGIGGLGGAAASYLAAAGVGRLILVHPGDLEWPDLNRQTLMRPDDIGTPRVNAAARTLRLHHPGVQVEAHDRGIADDEVPRLLARADVVLDARHNFPERHQLCGLCRDAAVPEVVAAMDGTQVQLTTYLPGGPCWRCLFPVADPGWQPLGFRVLGAVSGTAGCLAATEVVKVLTSAGRPLAGRLLFADLWEMSFRTFTIPAGQRCQECQESAPAAASPAFHG